MKKACMWRMSCGRRRFAGGSACILFRLVTYGSILWVVASESIFKNETNEEGTTAQEKSRTDILQYAPTEANKAGMTEKI